jgi:hypothetical protein
MPLRRMQRANALVLLDDDTIRTWFRLYQQDGIENTGGFGFENDACHLSGAQHEAVKAWMSKTLPPAAGKCRRLDRADVRDLPIGAAPV